MALIPYPLDFWNTFAVEAEADLHIGSFVDSVGKAAYGALDSQSKEAILMQTSLQMKLCPNIRLPDTLETDLSLAQCYLVVHALETDMMAYDANSKAITSESVDVISVTYDASKKGSNSDFPTMVSALLKQYGCSGTSGGFSQIPLGRA